MSSQLASAGSPGQPDAAAEVQAAKAKLQRAKRTLDAMKKREGEALAAKAAAEAKISELEGLQDQVWLYSPFACHVISAYEATEHVWPMDVSYRPTKAGGGSPFPSPHSCMLSHETLAAGDGAEEQDRVP